MQTEFVTTKNVAQLINHYYNVWKLRATHQSRLWFAEREAEEAAYQVGGAGRRQEGCRWRGSRGCWALPGLDYMHGIP